MESLICYFCMSASTSVLPVNIGFWYVLECFGVFEQANLSDFSDVQEEDMGPELPCEAIQDESNNWWLVHGDDRIHLLKPSAQGWGFWFVESNENNDWVVGDGKRSKLAKDLIAARMQLLAWSIKSGNCFFM